MISLPLNRLIIQEIVDRLQRLLHKDITRTGNYDIWWQECHTRVTVSHHREVIFEMNIVDRKDWFLSELGLDALVSHLRQVMVLDDVADA